jgi:predicted O-methyltransferase YrrM
MKAALRSVVPRTLVRWRWTVLNHLALRKVGTTSCDARTLGRLGDVRLARILRDEELGREWAEVERELGALAMTGRAGGVNPGDRRALYYLVRALKPRSMLEVGTHVGASTAAMACALRRLSATEPGSSFGLSTVDIRDVNAPTAPWRQFGSSYPPSEMLQRLGCDQLATFITARSLDYLASCHNTYDLIFLDGDHSAAIVYREIPAALRRLRPGGLIVLHDYFPRMQPLWHDGMVSPGPYLATERLRAEGAGLRVLPFGALPWPTKLQSNVTSLALVERQ